MKLKYVLAILLILVVIAAYFFSGQKSTWSADAAFEFNGKPVHPYCIDMLNYPDEEFVDLTTCSGEAVYPNEEGVVYAENPEEEGVGYTGFVQYKVHAQNGDRFLISSTSNGGGTGYFDWISIVEKKDSKLTIVSDIIGGDRCNGGLRDVSFKDGTLYFSQQITPIDLVRLSRETTLEAYDDLEASAGSCAALVKYEFLTSQMKADWQSVEFFEGRWESTPERDKEYPYQACFNEIFNRYQDQGKLVLNKTEVDGFVQEFYDTCVPGEKIAL